MFQRRNRPSLLIRLRNFVWPSIGWRRSFSYLGHRVGRLQGTPYSIAAGFACGASIAMTPFLGVHLPIAAFVAWCIGANPVAAVFGGLIGNWWTWPFILWATYHLGHFVLGSDAAGMPEHLTFSLLWHNVAGVFIPMLVGGILIGIPLWFIVYLPLHAAVVRYRAKRALRCTATMAAVESALAKDRAKAKAGQVPASVS